MPPGVEPPGAAEPSDPLPTRPSSARARLARSMRRNHSVRRFAGDGSYASRHIFGLSVGVGLLLSVLVPPDIPGPAGRLSAALGWASTGCWLLGWYPQVAHNFVRRSAAGVSLAYMAWNALGFFCYSIFTASLYWSPAVRAEYRAAHGGADSDVRSNDVFFALHALAMTLVAAAQAAAYGTGGQTLSVAAAAALGGAVAGIAVYARLWAAGACGCVSALALLNALAAVKVGTTAVKYAPQVALHYRTGSTAGFSSANALTDLAGGALSLGQQALDAWLFRDASIITGDMPKLGLSLLSIIYSCILIGQHWAYSGRGGGGGAAGGGEGEGEGDGDGRGAPLLG